MIWINDDEVLNCIITCTSLHCKSTTVDTSWQLNMAKHEVNTTRNAPMCLKRSPSTNELVSTVLSQLIYLFLNVRGKWNVQPSFVQKKIPYLLKTWWFMRLFFLPLLHYIWGKKTTGLFCDIHMYSNLKEN